MLPMLDKAIQDEASYAGRGRPGWGRLCWTRPSWMRAPMLDKAVQDAAVYAGQGSNAGWNHNRSKPWSWICLIPGSAKFHLNEIFVLGWGTSRKVLPKVNNLCIFFSKKRVTFVTPRAGSSGGGGAKERLERERIEREKQERLELEKQVWISFNLMNIFQNSS